MMTVYCAQRYLEDGEEVAVTYVKFLLWYEPSRTL